MTPVFHAVESILDFMEMLNSFVSRDDKTHDDNLSILLVILSLPVEKEDFSVLRTFMTSASETAANQKSDN